MRLVRAAVLAVVAATVLPGVALASVPEPIPVEEMVGNRLERAVERVGETDALTLVPMITAKARQIHREWVESYEASLVPDVPEVRVAAAIASSPTPPAAGSLADLICSYPWDCTTALGVSRCESGISTTAGTPGNYYGLFQVDYETSSDPVIQVRHAYEKYTSAGGWYPWGYPDGAFGCYWG